MVQGGCLSNAYGDPIPPRFDAYAGLLSESPSEPEAPKDGIEPACCRQEQQWADQQRQQEHSQKLGESDIGPDRDESGAGQCTCQAVRRRDWNA